MLKVKYIGRKSSQSWLVDGRSVLWDGPGAVLDVPDSFATTIAAHPGQWEIVGHEATDEPGPLPEEPDTRPPLLDIQRLDKSELLAYVQREFGEAVDSRWTVARLRKYVQERIAQHDLAPR